MECGNDLVPILFSKHSLPRRERERGCPCRHSECRHAEFPNTNTPSARHAKCRSRRVAQSECARVLERERACEMIAISFVWRFGGSNNESPFPKRKPKCFEKENQQPNHRDNQTSWKATINNETTRLLGSPSSPPRELVHGERHSPVTCMSVPGPM